MRTNLTQPSAGAAPSYFVSSTIRTRLWAHLGAALLTAVCTMPGMSSRANAAEAPRAGPCQRVDDVNASLFPTQQIVAYDFRGDDAGKLKNAMDGINHEAAPDAALVRLVLVLSTDEAFAFQFGRDGCRTNTVVLDVPGMASVFE